jgi:hypothetical protein
LLVGELEEQQHAELFEVVAVGEAVVAEDGAVAPKLLDDAVGFGAHGVVEIRVLIKCEVRTLTFINDAS